MWVTWVSEQVERRLGDDCRPRHLRPVHHCRGWLLQAVGDGADDHPVHLFSIPFGTALGIYGLWVLLRRETEPLFRRA
jgi:hypothetical protein